MEIPHFYAHRVNTIEKLKNTPLNYGVEIDLRAWENKITLEHDPFKEGQDFEEWLEHYHHGGIILNIKSERIEFKVLQILEKKGVTDFFFLDSSFPMIYALISQNETRIAARFSELEGLETVFHLREKVNWVWVDCISKMPLNQEIFKKIKMGGLKICLVSPDLLGRKDEIESYNQMLKNESMDLDAICCKLENIPKWTF